MRPPNRRWRRPAGRLGRRSRANAHATLRLVACPSCRRRDPGALRVAYASALVRSAVIGVVGAGLAGFVTLSLSSLAQIIAVVVAGAATAALAYGLFFSPRDILFQADLAKAFGPLDGPPPPVE